MNRVRRELRRGTDWMAGDARALVSLGILRSTIGLVSFAYYVSCASDRHLLFGADGLTSTFGRFWRTSSRTTGASNE